MTGGPAVSFCRHAEVLQALADPALVTPGQRGADTAPQQALRAAAAEALSPGLLQAWQAGMVASAHALIDAWPVADPVDLVSQLAAPWSLRLALTVTGTPDARAAQAQGLAAQLFQAAAQATGGLHTLLTAAPATPGRWADVQTFVALSQSLPALLGNAWLALLQHPAAWAELQADPSRLSSRPSAWLGELLRLGSPARAVFREAAADTRVGHTALRAGDAVTLLLWDANRDPERFPDPGRLNLQRPAGGHLGLGGGLHHCPGAGLVQQALLVITQALLQRCPALQQVDAEAVWRDGPALRTVAALPVRRADR